MYGFYAMDGMLSCEMFKSIKSVYLTINTIKCNNYVKPSKAFCLYLCNKC